MVTLDAAGHLATAALPSSAMDGGATASATENGSGIGSGDSITSEDLADGVVTAAKLGLANTAYVAADGATALDNCDALIAKMAEATGPALVVLGPGTYDCDDRQVVGPGAVSLQGTDRKRTTITGSLEDPSGLEGLVVLGTGRC